MNWLCRIGLHKWRNRCRWRQQGVVWFGPFAAQGGPGWYCVGKNCKRCGRIK